jgi:hypothetical protein
MLKRRLRIRIVTQKISFNIFLINSIQSFWYHKASGVNYKNLIMSTLTKKKRLTKYRESFLQIFNLTNQNLTVPNKVSFFIKVKNRKGQC